MTELKRNPNPFIRMAQEAKRAQEEKMQQLTHADNKLIPNTGKKFKFNKGFGGSTVVRRSGRGG